MKKLLILVGLVALFAIIGAALAVDEPLPNDPHVNPDANACYKDGALDGKCGDDPEMWIGGWYMIRFQYHIVTFDQVPVAYQWMLPIDEPEEVEIIPVDPCAKPFSAPSASRCSPCGFAIPSACLLPG